MVSGNSESVACGCYDFFKVALEDSNHAIAKNSPNLVGSFHWATEFGLFASLAGSNDIENQVTNFVVMLDAVTFLFFIVLHCLFAAQMFDSLQTNDDRKSFPF